jgi:Spy/CpxP family protein refolding chaperone
MKRTAIRAALLVGSCFAASATLAAGKLDIKPGLWEITSTHHISGVPPLPKELEGKVTPEQRAQMEAAFKEEMAKGPQKDTERECITKRQAEQPFDISDARECTQTLVRTTPTTQEVRLSCTGEIKGSGVMRVTTPTPDTMKGTLDLQLGAGQDAMQLKTELEGHWLGPDCGDEEEADEDEPRTDDEDESDQ